MTTRYIRTLLLTGIGFLSPSLAAETWDVSVRDNFFSPNDLTIQVGDTVRWTSDGSMPHDVTADDGRFASPTSNNINYQRTFNTAEEILYYCTVHSSPGQNINTSMNGRINVVAAQETVSINAGMSDAWFEPATNGQGFYIVVYEGLKLVTLAWFTYDAQRPDENVPSIVGEAGHRWLTALGPYDGDTTMMDVYLTSGGVFDAVDPAAEQAPDPVGSIIITWSSCTAAELTYELPGQNLSGTIQLERIVLDNVPICEAGQGME